MAHRLEGWTAIRYAEKHGGTLKKFSDPTERALKRVSIKKAQRVAHEDARLIYMDVPHANNWRKRNPRRRNAGGTSTASRTATRAATEATTTGNKTSTSTGGASTSGGNVSISVKHNPARVARGKAVTLRNMASVTIRRLPGGAVAVTGRKLNGSRRKR